MAYVIETKYLGPTNYRGSRITARTGNGEQRHRVTVQWDYALDVTENHDRAALALIDYLLDIVWADGYRPYGWMDELPIHRGSALSEAGNVYTFGGMATIVERAPRFAEVMS